MLTILGNYCYCFNSGSDLGVLLEILKSFSSVQFETKTTTE